MTNDVSEKGDTCDRTLNNYDDACMMVHTTSCVSVTDVYIAYKTCTHKVGPCTWTKYGCKHDIVTNIPKMFIKWKREEGEKTQHKLTG